MGRFPYEKLTVVTLPQKSGGPEQVLELLDKVDLLSTKLDCEYPEGDINYNDGLPKYSHAFHKFTKFWGREMNPFLLRSTLRDDQWKTMILKTISEKVNSDSKIVHEYCKKIRIFLKRSSELEKEAAVFLNDLELQAFFNGNHNAVRDKRNIHGVLNINMDTPKTLEISCLFEKTIESMIIEKSELKRMRIFGNGEKVLSVVKDIDNKVKNYMFTRQGEMELEVGWLSNGNDDCVAVLAISEGQVAVKSLNVNGEGLTDLGKMSEMFEQNKSVLIRGKTLQQLMDNVVINHVVEAATEIATLMQPTKLSVSPDNCESKEEVTVQELPQGSEDSEETILSDFEKLSFAKGPFSVEDEFNYNDGQDADPFDKAAKIYGRHKKVFLFNEKLARPDICAQILDIMAEKSAGHDEPPNVLLENFEARMNIYLERVSMGTRNAKDVLREGCDGFFYGRFVDAPGFARNIYENLNINLTQSGRVFETSQLVGLEFGGEDPGKVERLKLFGNGSRLMQVLRNGQGQRNYGFTEDAKLDMKIKWTGWDETEGKEIKNMLNFDVRQGKIRYKKGTVNGRQVGPEGILKQAQANKKVLLKNKSLDRILRKILKEEELARNSFDCESRELLVVIPPKVLDEKGYQEFYDTLAKLNYSNEPGQPWDALNFNFGEPASLFNKFRKFCGRHLDISLFVSLFEDDTEKEKIINVVKGNCNNDDAVVQQFENDMEIFLDRIRQGREDVVKFTDLRLGQGWDAFFTGYHVADEYNAVNPNANLNIAVGNDKRSFLVSDYFQRCYGEDKGELARIKLLSNGKRISTIARAGKKGKNFMFSNEYEGQLEVKWKAKKGEVTRECVITLNVKDGMLDIWESKVDGIMVPIEEMLGMIQQNNRVFVGNKSLHDAIVLGKKQMARRLRKLKEAFADVTNPDRHLAEDGVTELCDEDKFVVIGDDKLDADQGNIM